MARPSNISALPPEVKAWLDSALMAGNFQGYDALANALRERGCIISKSGIHRYGQKLEQRLQAIKNSTEVAKIFGENIPDTENYLTGGLISMVQAGMFDALANLQDAEDEDIPTERLKFYTSAARGIAEVGRASIANKKWQAEVRAKTEAAAAKVDAITRKGGFSAELAEEIRREILGIAA